MNNETLAHNQSFKADKLYDYVKMFSFPRLAGTEGEKKAVDLTVKAFEKIGFEKSQIRKEYVNMRIPSSFLDFYNLKIMYSSPTSSFPILVHKV